MVNILTEFPTGREALVPFHRVFQKNWDYYSGAFALHYPKNMKPSELEQRVYDAYRLFYSWRTILKNLFKGKVETAFLQVFQRLMIKSLLREIKVYIPYLKRVEEGMYDASGRLIEEKLIPLKTRKQAPSLDRPRVEADLGVISRLAS
jgi:hypothetical protein